MFPLYTFPLSPSGFGGLNRPKHTSVAGGSLGVASTPPVSGTWVKGVLPRSQPFGPFLRLPPHRPPAPASRSQGFEATGCSQFLYLDSVAGLCTNQLLGPFQTQLCQTPTSNTYEGCPPSIQPCHVKTRGVDGWTFFLDSPHITKGNSRDND